MKDQNLKKGLLFAFLTSIISGIAIFYAKIAVVKIDPLILTTSRNLYVGAIFLLWFLISKKLNEIKKLPKKQLIWLILIGVVGGALPFFLFFTGLQLVGAQTANLIHKTLFIWVSALTAVLLSEKFNLIYAISFVLIFVGNFYFAKLPLVFGRGELLILAATILWSIETILAKKVLKKISSELIGLFRMGIGSFFLLLLALTSGKGGLFLSYNSQQLSIVFIGGTILFFYVYFWYKALRYAPASLVTLVLTFSVVVGNVLSGAFAGVKILPKDIYSSLFIFIGISLLFFKQRLSLLKTVFK